MFGFEHKKVHFRSYSHQFWLWRGKVLETVSEGEGWGIGNGIGGGGYSCIASDTKYQVMTCLAEPYLESRVQQIKSYFAWPSSLTQMTKPDLKSTHRSCVWIFVKPLDRTFLKTPYECFMWYLTDVLLNTEDENRTQDTHIYLWSFL